MAVVHPRIVDRSPGLAAGLHLGLANTTQGLIRSLRLRGYGKSLALLEAAFGRPGHWVTVSVFSGGRLRLPLTDGYWIYYLFGGPAYEPELEWLLPRLLVHDEYFIDCGANIGYWSVFASRLVSPQQIVAVEAVDGTFRWLAANSRLNGDFRTVHQAVWSRSGEPLILNANLEHPASASVSAQGEGSIVQSISVDDLAEDIPTSAHFVVKLDIEGSEMAAFRGAVRTLSRPCIFLYEDHGSDLESELTRDLMTELELKVFYLNPAGRVDPVTSVDTLRELKVDPTRGYIFATAVPGSWGAGRLGELSASATA
jgi:FkbM family methyltransferase